MQETIVTARGSVGTGRQVGGILSTAVSYWYVDGEAGIRETAYGLFLLHSSSGEKAVKVMRSRIMNDYILNPASLLPQQGARWQESSSDDRAQVSVSMDGQSLELDLEVDAEGRLLEVVAQRWGSVGTVDRQFTDIPHGVLVDEEKTFDGYTIPTKLRSGWWYGTEKYMESLLITIQNARFHVEKKGEQK